MKYTIATLASHSCLQILKGAKDEGFATLAISAPDRTDFYKRFKFIDEVIEVKNYREIYTIQKELFKRNCIIIPHGSFVAYLGEEYDTKLKILHYGNKKVLKWEGDRLKQRKWLEKAGLRLPKIFNSPVEIDRLVIVKLYGARGGSGYFLTDNKKDFSAKIKQFGKEKYVIQEYIIGVPVYFQFFYSAIKKELELLGIDRRYETSVDAIGRIPTTLQNQISPNPSYTVIGNFPIAVRESLLPQVFEEAENVIELSQKMIPPHGLYGPFCLETVITPDCSIHTIEISARIVAGTNVFSEGSPYSFFYYDEPMSTGRRIAREIKDSIELNRLSEILN